MKYALLLLLASSAFASQSGTSAIDPIGKKRIERKPVEGQDVHAPTIGRPIPIGSCRFTVLALDDERWKASLDCDGRPEPFVMEKRVGEGAAVDVSEKDSYSAIVQVTEDYDPTGKHRDVRVSLTRWEPLKRGLFSKAGDVVHKEKTFDSVGVGRFVDLGDTCTVTVETKDETSWTGHASCEWLGAPGGVIHLHGDLGGADSFMTWGGMANVIVVSDAGFGLVKIEAADWRAQGVWP